MELARNILQNECDHDASYSVKAAFQKGIIVGLYRELIQKFKELQPDSDLRVDSSGIELANCDSREMLRDFLFSFGGSWKKSPDDYRSDKIQYIQEFPHPLFEYYTIQFKARQVTPPPSCKIVEEDAEVPARIEKRKRIVCPEIIALADMQEFDAVVASDLAPTEEPQQHSSTSGTLPA